MSVRRPQPFFGFGGGVAGVARDTVGVVRTASEVTEVPYAFVAETVTVYDTPLRRPFSVAVSSVVCTDTGVACLDLPLSMTGVAVTV